MVRLTTWNVNGIRNPFSYHPWREKRSFEAMFDALDADIVIFQEAKIQKKDLQDDMVLVNGWDCFFSLPKYKKGYSGVVIYTRNSKCCPIRAEEGITGILCLPASVSPFPSPTSFRDLPEEAQIGGYPTAEQLALSDVDASTLDSEGRCMILEFPAFVLIGVYCPANRDETRDGFRTGFVNILDARVRNLVAMGKRVIVTGDLNISGSEIDSARALEEIRKGNLTDSEFVSAPVRRVFNQLVYGGKVIGDKDQGRESPVLVDLCRKYHPDRPGMYTCWEQRVNARPGNYGSRIDYVLCDKSMEDWFSASNIQEGLMGSDHCPVFADLKDKVLLDGTEVDILDILNPKGTFENGQRNREYSSAGILPLSGRLIPEFCQRRSIKDMLFRQRSQGGSQGSMKAPNSGATTLSAQKTSSDINLSMVERPTIPSPSPTPPTTSAASNTPKRPRKGEDGITSRPKRLKRSESSTAPTTRKGQKTLKGFFGPKESSRTPAASTDDEKGSSNPSAMAGASSPQKGTTRNPPPDSSPSCPSGDRCGPEENGRQQLQMADTLSYNGDYDSNGRVHDPIANKESWTKLFTKKPPPRCEGHNEPCINLVTKKAGINRGRSFWICPRPLGPTGIKKAGDQWRCDTFIWSSDWNGPG
ncbi:AP endonuclease 2 [Blastomyces silverae]|uniref:DNA-(apurinic or apyrimidinic site) endonuclease 2 n=1 Tax=Blastomyces silverae TaxID=2060906 RepID=A0A0H1B7R6_9EURO|nr:AP endonuclease 2 [Blastomyces silverae]